jgi:hypothetical protein
MSRDSIREPGAALCRTADPVRAHGCPVKYRVDDWCFLYVMAGRGPAIHDFTDRTKDVDGRHNPRARPGDMGRL